MTYTMTVFSMGRAPHLSNVYLADCGQLFCAPTCSVKSIHTEAVV